MLTPTKAWICGMNRTNGSYWKDGLLKYKLWKCVRVDHAEAKTLAPPIVKLGFWDAHGPWDGNGIGHHR